MGADGGSGPWSLLLPQDFRSCTDRVPQKWTLLVHQMLRPLRRSLRLPDTSCSTSSSWRRPALLLHEQVDVALLRLLLLLFPAFVLHHQLADGLVGGDGVQFVSGAFPPFLSPPSAGSQRAPQDAGVSPVASVPEVVRQTSCAAVKRQEVVRRDVIMTSSNV